MEGEASESRPTTPIGSSRWFGFMGEQKGLRLFHDIVATNGMSIRKGHTLLANFGRFPARLPLALTAYSYRVEQMKNVRGRAGRALVSAAGGGASDRSGRVQEGPASLRGASVAGFLPDRCPENPGGSGKPFRPTRASRRCRKI